MKHLLAAALFLSVAFSGKSAVIFAESFNRGDSTSLGSTPIGGFTWNEQETVASGLQISGNRLVAGSTTTGREYATVNLSSAPGYSTTLSGNSGLVSWGINMKSSRSDPSGFDSANYGIAFVLAASSTDYSVGSGYAVVLGQNSSTDPIRLARFNNGLDLNSQFTDIISGGDYADEYLSVRVTYDPGNNNWALYLVASSSTFSDPTLVATQVGSSTSDSTYTSTALNYTGVLWNHATSGSESGIFDNASLYVVPEPREYAAVCALGLTAFWGVRQRWARRSIR